MRLPIKSRPTGNRLSAQLNSPFGVYIHWPFCAAKCPYCDFNSHVRQHKIDQGDYLTAFCTELAQMRQWTGPRTVSSIFFGGGTPSLMAPGTVAGIIDQIAGLWSLDAGAEITLEANPTSVEADRFAGYHKAGVNRVSLGVQALDNEQLKRLGRLHSVEDAVAAIRLARDIFPRLSFDLIYARPHQQPGDWRCELNQAIDYAADHLSLYQLTIEPDTPFYGLHKRGKLPIPDDDQAVALYELTQEVTQMRGLPAYEVSNHAMPGAESQHNLLYWQYGDYVGVGPGAHGRFMQDGRKLVTHTERHPEVWLSRVNEHHHGVMETESLGLAQQADERLVMGLRLNEGVDLTTLSSATGFEVDPACLEQLQSDGFVTLADNRLTATPSGRLVLNRLVCELAQSLVNHSTGVTV